MAEELYSVLWVAALTPELAMLPDSDIFTYGTQKRSLTATARDVPGLLFKESDYVLISQAIRKLSPLGQAEHTGAVQNKKQAPHAKKHVRGKMKV